jgi:hypothetical protein
MKQNEYYAEMLRDLREELDHETILINGLKKALYKLQREEWKPLNFLEEVIAERETRKDSVTRAIKKIEEVTKTKK